MGKQVDNKEIYIGSSSSGLSNVEVIHKKGSDNLERQHKIEIKKRQLRMSLGADWFDKHYPEAKSFFELRKKEIIKK